MEGTCVCRSHCECRHSHVEVQEMRAAIQFTRDSERDRWRPVACWLSHGDRIEVRVAPDEPDAQRVVDRLLADGHPPLREDGSVGNWSDWVAWFVWDMSNGADRWVSETAPDPDIGALYLREVAGPRQALAER